ncbi:prepilin-type N-terminal cleavage/methylation domain-containing protein [Pseudomonas nicosulfuronedens]|uniref:Prepilin-type N-terminal cleavage/methylation domain-containing protein n=1 Tax=Pseudomonas nicosulfuronedens TaxID=2571105 RepID=A0A5R9R916_9PSED|nr:type IV pilin protein [Pseudomonas nicosulfuronedens]MDH1011386.1 prepilin-type N-terminal cleavage/methylation domain-containing protein [Pseudomonas nicosulfuronedens]MDH1982161.1 prepilin-type N-terminal cleavage/methylation domain-containing protein [Pseudomonas nicosulfuronedens]MDH2030750.1 prepilin-type N-terminal cleavage/methylation domain-containing protein [Pseudomonas nicosulfuronedens]TLX70349.1 prepilin-type N-terminal cleavage/methylation domain-containing protein [Pseudomonas
MNQRRRERGFTLIELMIAVVVVAILAAIAFPSYQRYVLRSHRVEAQAVLSEAAARQERYYSQNNAYASTAAALNMTSNVNALQYYSLAISNVTATAYTLTATAKGSQAKDGQCLTLSLDQAGTRSNTGTGTGTTCWQ